MAAFFAALFGTPLAASVFAMGVISVRVVTLIDSIGIEVPNRVRHDVSLQSMLESKAFIESDARLPVVIGYSFEQRIKERNKRL